MITLYDALGVVIPLDGNRGKEETLHLISVEEFATQTIDAYIRGEYGFETCCDRLESCGVDMDTWIDCTQANIDGWQVQKP